MTPKELLEAAYEKIKNPDNRCTGAYARDIHGFGVFMNSSDACQWCAFGSLFRVGYEYNIETIEAGFCLEQASFSLYNKHTTAAFDEDPKRATELYAKAIELAEQEENDGLSH